MVISNINQRLCAFRTGVFCKGDCYFLLHCIVTRLFNICSFAYYRQNIILPCKNMLKWIYLMLYNFVLFRTRVLVISATENKIRGCGIFLTDTLYMGNFGYCIEVHDLQDITENNAVHHLCACWKIHHDWIILFS